ncbi:CueP family metal-binding protein, partial [Micrococcus luteus]|nr:CueP family metal-binding protein [Micrococcus luteus]MCV7579511.1 CueP family metal-binding protein [Micrococcus luteus]MCV7634174.1 CueP family metal-binding protein [Micrococcus luteus]MCV7728216.1 CueP family metal-binding protein [Micrococcus luteus]
GSSRGHHWAVLMAVSGSFPGHLWAAFHGRLHEIITRLDSTKVTDRSSEFIASIEPDQLVLTDDQNNQTTVPMPEDEFYVSIAPYRSQTHECYFHSLTTCTGELANTDVHVTVVEATSGETLLDETLTTYDNGFVGVWLPRGIDATLTVSAEGRTAKKAISTRPDDPTCLTGLQLA